ncbi:hypothetical protein [Pseudoduganella ginsengisoli]|uniref:Uncharacterized protein n=1 Tax=Pseudoduganella ginsengisoli TaxID=1462440 RepID=A0A6L6Q954_9BURK|nr:hypothetical protein [Pseudoduganella ginsengisoli]MTW05966.1 hypothetical protein [Pseudoduganella ginsengisoli]
MSAFRLMGDFLFSGAAAAFQQQMARSSQLLPGRVHNFVEAFTEARLVASRQQTQLHDENSEGGMLAPSARS